MNPQTTSQTKTSHSSNTATGYKRKAFVDGSNLLLGLLDQGAPSVLVFANVIAALCKHDFEVITIFDQSTRYQLERRGCRAEWEKLLSLADASKGQVSFQVQADPHLLAMASASGKGRAVIVNFTDRYKTWTSQFPDGLPEIVRVSYASNMLSFAFEGSNRVFAEHIDRQLNLFGVSLADDGATTASNQQDKRPEKFLLHSDRTSRTLRARLVVFALDGSGSMENRADGAFNTFDGRRKSEHLAEVFKGVVARLAKSKSAPSFYAGLVSFAGIPTVVEISGARMAAISHLNNHISAPGFCYSDHAKGNGTDLSAALDTAVQLVDAVLSSPDARYVATQWSACIILITDALCTDDEKVRQTVARLGMDRGGLTSGQIDIGVVGIGADVKDTLLVDIASSPSPATRRMLALQHLESRLLTRSSGERCLALKVNQKDASYPEVIRNFVDVVSQTA